MLRKMKEGKRYDDDNDNDDDDDDDDDGKDDDAASAEVVVVLAIVGIMTVPVDLLLAPSFHNPTKERVVTALVYSSLLFDVSS
ncbi:hypothetical protein M0802_011994 [Mischocyttarus mexicanus]|nr:hypothetical protein M0802_011994 [Mischocyttarus mexicanus]